MASGTPLLVVSITSKTVTDRCRDRMHANFLKLTQRIREEFDHPLALELTVDEAAEYFGLEFATCASVLAELLRRQHLERGPYGRYRRATAANDFAAATHDLCDFFPSRNGTPIAQPAVGDASPDSAKAAVSL